MKSVTNHGVIQLVFLIFIFIIMIMLGTGCTTVSLANQPTVTLDPNTTYQTITGWEAVAQAGQLECDGFENYRDALFDEAAFDLGINRVRLQLNSGAENPVDYFSKLQNGEISRSEYRDHWYEIINDNDDPNHINASGFQFSELDHTIDTVVVPLKQRLEAEGESLFINLNLVDFMCCQGSSNVDYENAPEEYAELVLATYQHLQAKYGWVPNAWEVVLEPDTTPWNGGDIGNAIASAASRLQTNGYTPSFIAPSTTNMGNASSYFDDLINVPGVEPYLKELSYHRYGGVSDPNLLAIANRAQQFGINTSMLEHIGSGYQDLHKDLTLGRNSAWQQFTLAFCVDDDGAQYYVIDDSDPNNPIVTMGGRTKFLRQYFKFVRAGAHRIGATSNNSNFEPVAFVNQDGKYVVVVKSDGGGSFSIQGLPAGTYGIKYTTSAEYDIDLPVIAIGNGQDLDTSIPAAGVITIYMRDDSSPTPTSFPPELDETVFLPYLSYNMGQVGVQVSESLESEWSKSK